MKILVVDDDESFALMVKDALEIGGHTVRCRFDPLSASAALRDFKPDAVVMDVDMPAGGGRALLCALRGNTDTGNLPIVVVTATQDPARAWAALGAGPDPRTWMLHKPVEPGAFAQILGRIEAQLRGGR